ncbi:MAG: hypothetical protein JKY99_12825 [Rhizobiales bacterium]|nr:hypothetical protein [Hyphomicrobiales bacterium]
MSKSKPMKGQLPSPISLRHTDCEKQQLVAAAKGQTMSGFIRYRLFETDALKPVRAARGQYIVKDHQAIAKVLALLGKSTLGTSMSTLANAANFGSLPVTGEIEVQLRHACNDIAIIKSLLMKALAIQED